MIDAQVVLYAVDGTPTWEDGNLHLSPTLVIAMPADQQRAGDWCARLGASLLTRAEVLYCDHRLALRYLAEAEQAVVQLRRGRGEIATDGWCWSCKADDHRWHRAFHHDGGCIGCVCPFRASEVDS